MSENEFSQLKGMIERTDKKVDRILSWAEGDAKLGTPSVMQRINENTDEIKKTRHFIHQVEDKVDANAIDIKNLNRKSGAIGAGTSGAVVGVIEAIKQFFFS